MILVDTSVWIDHFQKGISSLAEALDGEHVLTHPFVVGELACGELKRRREILELLSMLPSSVMVRDEEALHFIEHHRLMGKGVGYIDAHLLASVKLTADTRLWTRDKRLGVIATAMGISIEE